MPVVSALLACPLTRPLHAEISVPTLNTLLGSSIAAVNNLSTLMLLRQPPFLYALVSLDQLDPSVTAAFDTTSAAAMSTSLSPPTAHCIGKC